MSKPTQTTEVLKGIIEPFDTLDHTILVAGLCYVIGQYNNKLHVYQELQSVLADTPGNRKRLETKRSLLVSSRACIANQINMYKKQRKLPAALCNIIFTTLEDIR